MSSSDSLQVPSLLNSQQSAGHSHAQGYTCCQHLRLSHASPRIAGLIPLHSPPSAQHWSQAAKLHYARLRQLQLLVRRPVAPAGYGLCGGALGMSAKGPDEASRNTHSDCFPHSTECSVYGGISEYEPGARVFSPEPAYRTIIVPKITTTRSTDGCLCGGGA